MIFLLDVNVLLAMSYGDHVLEDLKSSVGMLFIPDELTTRHLPMWVRKSEQMTDGYLLALAKAYDGSCDAG